MAEKRIREKHLAIKEMFSSVISHPVLSLQFRAVLRELNASSLEVILFDNHTDEIESSIAAYRFPDEETINATFIELNDKYQFFNQDNFAKAQAYFSLLFKGCKLIADYVECNNGQNNQVAYSQAYKIAVFRYS